MPSEYVLSRLKDYYDPFPVPCDEGFEAVDLIAGWLKGRGVQGTGGGVIAVAHAANGHIYFAFSQALQKECKDLRIYQNIRDAHPDRQTFCVSPGTTMLELFSRQNPTCAEKKILASVKAAGTTIANLTVGEYPQGSTANHKLTSHTPIGDQERAYVAPCKSCKSAYTWCAF